MQMRCCGADSSYDWATSRWANQSERSEEPYRRRAQYELFIVPDSCCFHPTTADDTSNTVSSLTQQMAPVCRNVRLTPANNVNNHFTSHLYLTTTTTTTTTTTPI